MTTIILEVPGEADVAELQRKPGYRVVGVVQDAPTLPKATAALREPRDWTAMLSDEDAALLRKHTEQVREEWDRNF